MDFDLTVNVCKGIQFMLPVILLRKTDLKKFGVVYVWNPHHHTYPPSYFSFLHACNPTGCKSRFVLALFVFALLQLADF